MPFNESILTRLFFWLHIHKKSCLFIFISIFPFAELFAQTTAVPYRVFIELKAGLHRERNLLTDPGGQLGKPQPQPITGINVGMSLKDGRSAISLELDNVSIGNFFLFDSIFSLNGSGRNFIRLSPMYNYHLPLVHIRDKPKFSIFGKIGPSVTFTGSPRGTTGQRTTVIRDNNNDTLAYSITNDKLNRTFFAGITLGAGFVLTPNPRLRFAYNIYNSWNVTSNNVVIKDKQYMFVNNTTVYNARSLSTGTTLTQTLSIGYAFGNTQQRRDEIERKKRLYTAEEWAKRKRWSLIFNTSNSYPALKLHDPAGYLTNKPDERFTFGTQVFYRFATKWYLGTGFETVPFQLNARLPSMFGGGASVGNSFQIPLFTEYQLLNTNGRMKFQLLGRGGFAFGIQRKYIVDAQQGGSYFELQPQFYNELEAKDRPSKRFLAGLAGVRGNLFLSKKIFLTGYIQNQWALTKSIFHRSRVQYQVESTQTLVHNAELSTKGSILLPGFGIGFQL